MHYNWTVQKEWCLLNTTEQQERYIYRMPSQYTVKTCPVLQWQKCQKHFQLEELNKPFS